MPRPNRIEYPHAFYHIMNRGGGRKDIFHNDKYYSLFLNILSDAHKKFDAIIHAYCLMGNHYHLILETPRGNLSRIMRHINGVYTQKYNRLHKTDGPLFCGRFKAVLVDKDSYLLELNRYVHRNPLATKNKLVKNLQDYKWSSYNSYINMASRPVWLDCKTSLQMLGKIKFRTFIAENNNKFIDKFYSKKDSSAVIGDEDFKNKIYQKIKNEDRKEKLKKDLQKYLSPSQIIDAVAMVFDIKISVITRPKNRGTKKNFPRILAIYLCRKYCKENLANLAKIFGFTNIKAFGNASHDAKFDSGNRGYKKWLNKIENVLRVGKMT